MITFALMGAKALWLLYLWLLSAILASYLSERKGYGEKLGLAFGLLLPLIGTIIWLLLAGASRTRSGRRSARSAAARTTSAASQRQA